MKTASGVAARDRLVLANNYANLLQEMGEEDAALAHYRIALELANDDRARAVILTNIGNTEFRLRRYEQAIADFEQALPLREKAEGKDSPGLSFALEGLGSAALALRHLHEAEQYFARAVALRGINSAPNHSQLNVLNFGLALAHWGQGHDDDAFRLAVHTAQQQHSLLNSLATGFSEQQSVAYDNLLVPATALAVTIAAGHRNAAEIATVWRLVMIERGLIARAEARRLAIARANADPQLGQLYRDWRVANSALGDGWISSRTGATKMSELQAAAEAAERALWAKLGYRQDDPANAAKAPDELARVLPNDGLLLAFTEGVGADAARTVAAGSVQPAEDMYAFVLYRDRAPALQRIGRIDALTAQVHGWYGMLRDPHSDPDQLLRRGRDLRRDLLGPIDGVDASKSLFVIPTGELFRVSFAALPESNGDRYWIEAGVRVHTLAHESDLLIPAASGKAVRALLAGAPQFGEQAHVGKSTNNIARLLCAHAAEQGFAAIPGAARELEGLRGTLRDALGAGGDVRKIDGAQATKERVLAALDGSEIVHLATHGFSFDATCGDDNARGMTLERAAPAATPVAQPLSGLAFAGADVSGGHAPVGVLSAGEMSSADLAHAGWVVLSACDSGLGPIGHTEGVFGMRRALRLAGASTVVMSLWEADDVATADLMQALYRARFAQHRNVPESMAQAMRETLAERRAANQSTHPYYWAAFVSEGGWR
jgi:CHAT domain-containing protein